jgi:hypothetical protein
MIYERSHVEIEADCIFESSECRGVCVFNSRKMNAPSYFHFMYFLQRPNLNTLKVCAEPFLVIYILPLFKCHIPSSPFIDKSCPVCIIMAVSSSYRVFTLASHSKAPNLNVGPETSYPD